MLLSKRQSRRGSKGRRSFRSHRTSGCSAINLNMLLALNLECLESESEHDDRSSHSAREAALADTCILKLYVPEDQSSGLTSVYPRYGPLIPVFERGNLVIRRCAFAQGKP